MPATLSLPGFRTPERRILENGLLVVELAILGWLVLTEGISGLLPPVLAGVGAIAIGLLVTRRWPLGAILVLIVSSTIPRVSGTLFGLHVRPEHVAAGAIALALIVRYVVRNRERDFAWSLPDYLLAAYVFVNFFTSTVASLSPRMTLRWATMNAIVVSAYFVIRILIRRKEVLGWAFDCLLWVGVLESGYGILCFLSNRIFGTEFGIAVGQYGDFPGTHGSQYEANIFGSYGACCAVMFLAVFLLDRKSRNRTWVLAGLILCIAGTFVSLARTALAALVVGGILVFLAAAIKGQVRTRQLVVGTCALVVLLLAISPLVGNLIVERFSTIDLEEISTDSTAWVRIVSLGAALDDIQTHPILGMGTDSLQLTFTMRDYLGQASEMDDLAGWVGNAPVRILHDTGVVGLGVFLSFLAALAVSTFRSLRGANLQGRCILIALAGGLLVYAITFQATEATLLAFPWVHMGLLAAGAELIRNQSSAAYAR